MTKRPMTQFCALLGRLGILTVALAFFVTGCSTAPVTAPVVPPPGGILTFYKAPLDFEFEEGGTPAEAAKTGTSKAQYLKIPFIGYLEFAWGDASLGTAAANGGITKVNYADYQHLNVLGIYQWVVIEAHGE